MRHPHTAAVGMVEIDLLFPLFKIDLDPEVGIIHLPDGLWSDLVT